MGPSGSLSSGTATCNALSNLMTSREGRLLQFLSGPNSPALSRTTATPVVRTPVQRRRRRQGATPATRVGQAIFPPPVNKDMTRALPAAEDGRRDRSTSPPLSRASGPKKPRPRDAVFTTWSICSVTCLPTAAQCGPCSIRSRLLSIGIGVQPFPKDATQFLARGFGISIEHADMIAAIPVGGIAVTHAFEQRLEFLRERDCCAPAGHRTNSPPARMSKRDVRRFRVVMLVGEADHTAVQLGFEVCWKARLSEPAETAADASLLRAE